jgi:hypothetical protein
VLFFCRCPRFEVYLVFFFLCHDALLRVPAHATTAQSSIQADFFDLHRGMTFRLLVKYFGRILPFFLAMRR